MIGKRAKRIGDVPSDSASLTSNQSLDVGRKMAHLDELYLSAGVMR